jgi:hypothetical protein
MKLLFTTSNNPLSWDTDEFGVITFASHEEAKKAERLFQEMQDEINRLRAAVPEAITLSEDRIREFAKPVADRHAARLGVAIGSGTLYHTLLLDVGDAIKKAVEFMNKERS